MERRRGQRGLEERNGRGRRDGGKKESSERGRGQGEGCQQGREGGGMRDEGEQDMDRWLEEWGEKERERGYGGGVLLPGTAFSCTHNATCTWTQETHWHTSPHNNNRKQHTLL
ncbi:unnamed protein product [Pleuronectes platessa]|uniref:Uncharacterized protein n=1 Tax=Pleuronectes platessa TaxID=8262 RepID=A0A9N7VJ66_PLEPL|nr:unnamed protein product [Pleuronectes platessa]